MMNHADLTAAELRTLIHARHELHDRAERLVRAVAEGGEERPLLKMRCDLPHRKASMPLLARAVPVGREVLFMSTIQWVARDAVQPPPWMVEHLLGVGWSLEALAAASDESVVAYAQSLERSAAGGERRDRKRWVRGMPPSTLLTVVTPDVDPVITPWTRCKDHPNQAEVVSRSALFSHLRA